MQSSRFKVHVRTHKSWVILAGFCHTDMASLSWSFEVYSPFCIMQTLPDFSKFQIFILVMS